MSVMARCAATPRICDRPNPVMAWTRVAPPAASASGSSSSGWCWLITRSITHLEEEGRTRPASRLTSISASPTVRRPRCAYTRARASCQAPGVMVFLGGRVGASAMSVTGNVNGRRRNGVPKVLDRVKYIPDIGPMAPRELEQRVETARRFNRFYTRRIGVLGEGAYKSAFSLTEVRVLYELAHRDKPTATALGRDLGLDAGYLSRILRGFERRGLVSKTRSPADGRQSHLSLTGQGRKVFAPLNARSHDEVAAMLGGLSVLQQARVVGAMRTMERLLGGRSESLPPASCVLRPPLPGDLGWVVHRHGAVYAQEYGYN